jgi:2-keto-4-pentenoate hydratase/2-oxohepta-3-ene-1,7-dioic acid hydratase in catechol pathway
MAHRKWKKDAGWHYRNLIFNIPFLVSYVSRFMTLLPGDIISTGTPAGVGLGFQSASFI